jgi:beta-galactosidase/beta-glucuronidase
MEEPRRVLSLDGAWEVIFDDDNCGRGLGWEGADGFRAMTEREPVTVPSCLEEWRQDYQGVAWYGRCFDLPPAWDGATVRLRMDAVNYRAEVWINGRPAGAHEGGYTGFEIDVTDLLVPRAANFIAVRVITPLITRDVRIDGLGRDEMPHWRGAIAGGIWQSVSLIATDSVYLQDVFVRPDAGSGEVALDIEIENAGTQVRTVDLACAVSPWQQHTEVAQTTATFRVQPGLNRRTLSLTVSSFRLWELDDPQLYTANVVVQAGERALDRVETRFGFREFTFEGKHFLLNGRKIVLKTTFHEGFYPHSLAYPRDRDLLRREFALIKEGNINMIRPWRKPQPPVVYDMADEQGVLFVGTLPVECMDFWPALTPYTQDRILTEVTESVRRDRNHPSIVMWEMFNEILRADIGRLRRVCSLRARDLDPTRVVMDESGSFAGATSLYPPHSREPVRINEVHMYPGTPLAQDSYDGLLALGKSEAELQAEGLALMSYTASHVAPDLLTNISELGYGSIPDLVSNVARYRREGNPITPDFRIHQRLHDSYAAALQETGVVDEVFPTFRDFIAAVQHVHYVGNKLMAEAARINPSVAGIGIHALGDGDWVVGAGLIDLFRNPKKSYYAIQEVFAPQYIAVRPGVQNTHTGSEVPVRFTSVNDDAPIRGTWTVTVTGPGEAGPAQTAATGTLAGGVADLHEMVITAPPTEGATEIKIEFKGDNGVVLTNTGSFHALQARRSELIDAEVCVAAEEGRLNDYLRSTSAGTRPFGPNAEQPLLIDPTVAVERSILGQVERWVAGGGTAVLLGLPPDSSLQPIPGRSGAWKRLPAGTVTPFALTLITGKGLWTPCSHVVRSHPVFEGLPVDCLMAQEYRNVVSRWSVVEPATEWIAGNITYGWHQGQRHKQNFLGVERAVHGADLAELPHGKGRYVITTYRIVEHLRQDPVADRLLANLVRWLR